ncbi:MAG: family 78 glycoside hydrolase catalytic domain [Clostridia bacterium]|nr:family 78 glycoside hydrolase catalytic domain [Clostridia bacterium]MBR0422042.1 family 78 glycoside hydrolase catalytic domain [Clostridia bacterium]
MNAIRLKTEYLFDPLGIDVQRPRLTWNAEGGVKQRAFEIVTDKWQSGKVESDEMHAVYPLPLTSRERVVWKVRLWDENDEPGDWAQAFFEMGLLTKDDWTAQWITGDYRPNRKERYPVDCFSKTFTLGKPVKSARLYATAYGLYEARLGGKRVGAFVMAPGYTDYTKRIQYQTYDVTKMLREGENELTCQLADGWFRGSCGAWGKKNQYGTETKLLLQLEIAFIDGSRQVIGTDPSWAWSNDGPIRQADNKDGEIVEAFRTPMYTGKARVTKHSVTPTASNNVPVTEHETFHPVITTAPNGKKLLNFGQNMAGYVRFSLNARLGQKMVWRFGEMLDENGNFTQKNIQLSRKGYTTPLQRIEYTSGEGLNEYCTTFAVFGFQYAEVEGDVELNAEDIEAVAVYSDLERTGDFSCSHELLNHLFTATLWSAKGNHLDIPTDCPTRERHGWTGDAQLFFTTASYLFDFAPFAKKYMRDVFDWQRRNGRLPHIVPDGGADFYMWTMNGSVGWSDVGVLIPWRYAQINRDDSILREFYDGMAKYARFMESRCGKNMPLFAQHVKLSSEARKYFVNQGQSYGEWAEPADVGGGFRWQDFVAPHPEVSTAYTSYVLGLMAQIAKKLGHEADAKEFQTYADGCKAAYRELVHTDAYSLDTDKQARLVRPLYFELLDAEQTAYAKKRLTEALEHYRWRLGTGFLSTPLILYVLADMDPEAAYRLLENEEVPGWLSMPKAGATTIWEAWEGPNSREGGIGSLNHYSKGAVVEWLFSTMCGIRITGENRFTVAPLPGGSLTHAEACYTSVFGRIESRWERSDGKTAYTVTVPANCEAEIILPKGLRKTVGAGTWTFTEE